MNFNLGTLLANGQQGQVAPMAPIPGVDPAQFSLSNPQQMAAPGMALADYSVANGTGPSAIPGTQKSQGFMDMMKNSLSGMGQDFQQHPEKWAIMADYLGSNLAPDNAAAGLGTMLGQSRLASQARQDQNQQMSSALSAGGGMGWLNTPPPPANPNMQSSGAMFGNSNFSGASNSASNEATTGGKTSTEAPSTSVFPGLTPQQANGVTSQQHQAMPDGSVVTTTKHTTAPPQQQVPTTINTRDLTGLTPDMINKIATRDKGIADITVRNRRINSNDQYRQGILQANAAQTPAKNYANRMLGVQRLQSALKAQTEAAIAAGAAPVEIAKLKAQSAKLQQETQVIQQTYQKEVQRQSVLQKLGNGDPLSSLNDQELSILFGNQTSSVLNNTRTQSRLAEQFRITEQGKREKAFADSVANAFNADDPDIAAGDMNRANLNSPDEYTKVLVNADSNAIGLGGGTQWQALGKTPDGHQITMADVRENAKKYGMQEAINMALRISAGKK